MTLATEAIERLNAAVADMVAVLDSLPAGHPMIPELSEILVTLSTRILRLAVLDLTDEVITHIKDEQT